jgi:hypothetical protein
MLHKGDSIISSYYLVPLELSPERPQSPQNMHERPVPPTGAQMTLDSESELEYQDWARARLRLPVH